MAITPLLGVNDDMRVPLLDLKGQLKPLRAEMLAGITELIDSTAYILGERVETLEAGVAEYCGVRHGIGVSSGTDALLAALMALKVGPGDFVLTTPYTFIATIGSILRLGARPLFADIDPLSYNISPESMREVLSNKRWQGRIKAVMPVHLYGQCADMTAITALARQYEIPIVEDAAQAIGAVCPLTVDGRTVWRRAGSMGQAGCFSFFPSKNLGGIGDGGMITVDDDELAALIRVIRVHGGGANYFHAVLGGNFRMDPIQAVALNVKLPHLPDWHRARRRNAALYCELLAECGLSADEITPPAAVYAEAAALDGEAAADYHVYNQFVIRCRRRNELKDYLQAHEVGCAVYYPIPMHKQGCVADMGLSHLRMPVAERSAAETLALPVYPELSRDMIHFVVENIYNFYRKAR